MRATIDGKEVRLPDFLIVGTAKAGTTALYYHLRKHPAVFFPDQKELFYLQYTEGPPEYESPANLRSVIVRSLPEYLKHFADAPAEALIGEASTSYLYGARQTIEGIRRLYGPASRNLKIIGILREPVARAWSQYMMFRRNGTEPLDSFAEAVAEETVSARLAANWSPYYDYLGFGRYRDQVAAYMDAFPHVRFWLYEDLVSDPQGLIQEICSFLGIDGSCLDDRLPKINQSGDVRNRWLFDVLFTRQHPLKSAFKAVVPFDLRQRLKLLLMARMVDRKELPAHIYEKYCGRFQEDIRGLEELLGRDLSCWRQRRAAVMEAR